MGFGNFNLFLFVITVLLIGNSSIQSQQSMGTEKFLYNQLDYFLQNPTPSSSLRLSKQIDSKKNQLITKADKLAWVIVHCNLGYYRNQYGSMSSAILYYEKAWKTYHDNNLTDYDIIENCLKPLGNLYIKIGDLQKADTTIKSYLYLAEKNQHIAGIISGITNLSIAYNNQGNHKLALKILEQGLRIDANNVNILTNIATNYLEINNYIDAKKYAEKVIRLDANQINAYQILAAISLEKKELDNAEKYIAQAKSHLLKDASTTARNIAKWQLAYIDILLSRSKFIEVQKNLKQIYTSLLPGYSEKSILPSKEILIADKILLKALDIQSYVYQQTDKPLEAIKSYDLAFTVNSKLNTLYPLQDTKIIQLGQNRNRTEAYIDLLFSIYQNTRDQQYIEQAFQAAEHSKAPFVNEALLSKKVLSQYQGDPMVKKKDLLSSKLASYETLILKEKIKGPHANVAQIQKWVTDYDIKHLDLKEITKALQNKYPKLLRRPKELSTLALQEKLEREQVTLLEYFYGNQSIYQFEIRHDSFRIKKIKNIDHFKKTIKNYIYYFDNASNIINDVSEFTKNATETYKVLNIPKKAEKLLIIPDGLLNFIPFETLLTENTNTTNFSSMPFLLRSTQLSYEISATKYVRSTSDITKENRILGVFPVFEKTDMELSFSLIESNSIQQYFKGDFIEKEQATYTNFLQKAKDHDIIHLSTHAESGNILRPASIKFRNQNVLVNQLYGAQIDANLVVLSACETGIGKLTKGEGPISVARGFQYAGVENVLFSLWKVNDKTTATLMSNFYKSLNKLKSKTRALHQAKLDYLDAENISNAQKSPYYWAAFVYYGEITPPNSAKYVWYVISIVLFLLIALLLRKFLQHKT